MNDRYTLYGAPGWGSAIAEMMLAWCAAPFDFVDIDGFDQPGPARERLLQLNPLAQVPTLVLPGGEIMTESLAIALLLSELYPQARLAPAPGTADRARFLRRLAWLSAAVYPTFTYADYPDRWAPEAGASFVERVDGHKQALWRSFDADLSGGPFCLGETFSALDIFVAVMVHWRPRPAWFRSECPRLYRAALAVQALEPLGAVLLRNFKTPLGAR
jgi:GST-like protein